MAQSNSNPRISKVNLREALSRLGEHWKPVIVGEVDECYVKVVKFQGEFCWHTHPEEDELFLVLSGRFTMRFRWGNMSLEEGEFVVVPKGTEHMPVAESEVQVLLVEPRSTINTGNLVNERTITHLSRMPDCN